MVPGSSSLAPFREEHATLSFIRVLAIVLGVLLIVAGLYTQKYATALIGLVVVVLNLRRGRRGSRPRAAENDETPS